MMSQQLFFWSKISFQDCRQEPTIEVNLKLNIIAFPYASLIIYIHIFLPNSKNLPAYSGKQIVRLDFFIFSSNKSFLLRKRMIDVSVNHLLLHMESNNFILSIIRFYNEKIKQHIRALCLNSNV